MDLAGIDRELRGFRSAADVVSANLLELDADPNRQLLDTAPLSGVTGAAWSDARTSLTSVWDWFARFTGFLDARGELRESPRTRLPPGASGSSPVPDRTVDRAARRRRAVARPRPAAASVGDQRCTADELLAVMTEAFARARRSSWPVGAVARILSRVVRCRSRAPPVGTGRRGRSGADPRSTSGWPLDEAPRRSARCSSPTSSRRAPSPTSTSRSPPRTSERPVARRGPRRATPARGRLRRAPTDAAEAQQEAREGRRSPSARRLPRRPRCSREGSSGSRRARGPWVDRRRSTS